MFCQYHETKQVIAVHWSPDGGRGRGGGVGASSSFLA